MARPAFGCHGPRDDRSGRAGGRRDAAPQVSSQGRQLAVQQRIGESDDTCRWLLFAAQTQREGQASAPPALAPPTWIRAGPTPRSAALDSRYRPTRVRSCPAVPVSGPRPALAGPCDRRNSVRADSRRLRTWCLATPERCTPRAIRAYRARRRGMRPHAATAWRGQVPGLRKGVPASRSAVRRHGGRRRAVGGLGPRASE